LTKKNKLFDSYNILNDKYKFGVHKIIEKDLKEKERVKKFMIETDDEIHLEMDTLDPITLRKIEMYVKDCFGNENILLSTTNSSDKSTDINQPTDPISNSVSPGGKSSPSLQTGLQLQNEEKSKTSELNQTIQKDQIPTENVEHEESSSSSSVNTDSSDSDSSEDVTEATLVIDNNNSDVDKSLKCT